MKFGELLKTKRKEMDGVSQEVLAEKLGVSKQTISNWESGRNMPLINDSVVDLMPSVLNVSKSEILSSLMENVGKCKDSKEERTINYPFLPSSLTNIRLSKEEVDLIFIKEAKSLEYKESKSLEYDDYVRVLGSYKDVVPTREKIGYVLSLIDVKTLTNIIRKNNLDTFDIQQLPEGDVYEILKSRKDDFDYLERENKALCFVKYKKNCQGVDIYDKFIEGCHLALKKGLYYDSRYNTYCLYDGNIVHLQYPDIFKEYFVQVECVSEEDMLVYNKKLEIYNEEMGIWNRKMVEIQKLQDLYGPEQYPDLPEPEAPELPKKQLSFVLNYKGISLKSFFQKMEKLESDAPKFSKNARVELAPYLDKEASLFGTLASKENNGYLFKSLYIAESGEMFDHLWAYDIKDRLDIGKTYNIKGTVHIYEKEEGGNLVKNYGVKVSEVSRP